MNVNIRSDKAISLEINLNMLINKRIFAQVLSCEHLCSFYVLKCTYPPKLMRIYIYTLFMFLCTVEMPEYSV